ncbi:hypothetical protein MKW98_021156 [Papaver atlanticum]|uniref:RING-type domain-containing protein n=1 Tax=Papaver atlanticum TaxID=357466 RepID=A0AAD4XQZ3_9MAGN|nr:hypothetical protein MKW98_021156 [Papaver atlanticum]
MPVMPPSIPKVPTFILLTCYILSIIKIFISSILQILGFVKFADSEDVISSHTYLQTENHYSVVASVNLIRRALPAMKFEDLVLTREVDACDQDSCAICLCEYEDQDEIRPLVNCRHIFHGSCLNRWMINNQTTCPLCRTSLVPIQIEKAFEESNLNVSSLET